MNQRKIPPLAAIHALAAMVRPNGVSRHGLADFGHNSRQMMNNPAGSTDPVVRKARRDRRVRKMRLRKLRGWH